MAIKTLLFLEDLPIHVCHYNGKLVDKVAIVKMDKTAVVMFKNRTPGSPILDGVIERVCSLYEPDRIMIDTRRGSEVIPVDSLFEKTSAINKEQMVESYMTWKRAPSRRHMAGVIRSLNPIVNRELHNYRGSVPENVLKGLAKKFTIKAVKTYNPDKRAALSTHVVNQLQQIHRHNYASFSTARLPEHLQQGVGGYLRANSFLQDKLGREPNAAEISDEMNWSIKQVEQVRKRLRNEIGSGALEFDPIHSSEGAHDTKLDYFYYDLNNPDKLIFEHSTGYGGASIISKKDIAAKLNLTPARITQKATDLAKRFRTTFGQA